MSFFICGGLVLGFCVCLKIQNQKDSLMTLQKFTASVVWSSCSPGLFVSISLDFSDFSDRLIQEVLGWVKNTHNFLQQGKKKGSREEKLSI
jgi:hypothetical protein